MYISLSKEKTCQHVLKTLEAGQGLDQATSKTCKQAPGLGLPHPLPHWPFTTEGGLGNGPEALLPPGTEERLQGTDSVHEKAFPPSVLLSAPPLSRVVFNAPNRERQTPLSQLHSLPGQSPEYKEMGQCASRN